MTLKQCLSAVVITAFVGGLAPKAWADGPGQAAGDRPLDLRASIARAAERTASDPSGQVSVAKPSHPVAARRQNGGGGHLTAIVSLVGVVAGAGATSYMVKQMQKTTTTIPTTGQ